jgi:uncharacterized membrane protein
MAVMHRRKLINIIDPERIRRAIQSAEKMTSGEIRVSISRFFWGRVRTAAERAFKKLEMAKTKDRNGILFFIVPARRRFVVLGDEGIHAKVGPDFWKDLAEAMSIDFKKGRFQEGLIAGIDEAGERLSTHFPYNPRTDKNELPDDVDFR